MYFLDSADLIEWAARQAPGYPLSVAVTVEGEQTLGIVVEFADGSEIYSGLDGNYVSDIRWQELPGVLFNKLTVAIALKRMKRNREELVKSGKD